MQRSELDSANIVHVDVRDVAVGQADELGVLTADLEDGLHPGVGQACAGGMRRDLVDDEVGTDDLADELAARAGGGAALDAAVRGALPAQGGDAVQQMSRGGDGVAGGAAVDIHPDAALRVHEHRLGGGGTDVHAQKER